mmetsp:Transcript_54322/g.89951  ORF Transcript_54322/g.89951 Transcript_54322/m.89951 type:complete len:395 (-) Transcript_54322:145-1329(-)
MRGNRANIGRCRIRALRLNISVIVLFQVVATKFHGATPQRIAHITQRFDMAKHIGQSAHRTHKGACRVASTLKLQLLILDRLKLAWIDASRSKLGHLKHLRLFIAVRQQHIVLIAESLIFLLHFERTPLFLLGPRVQFFKRLRAQCACFAQFIALFAQSRDLRVQLLNVCLLRTVLVAHFFEVILHGLTVVHELRNRRVHLLRVQLIATNLRRMLLFNLTRYLLVEQRTLRLMHAPLTDLGLQFFVAVLESSLQLLNVRLLRRHFVGQEVHIACHGAVVQVELLRRHHMILLHVVQSLLVRRFHRIRLLLRAAHRLLVVNLHRAQRRIRLLQILGQRHNLLLQRLLLGNPLLGRLHPAARLIRVNAVIVIVHVGTANTTCHIHTIHVVAEFCAE